MITDSGETMMNSVLEEADNRIICHIFDIIRNHNISKISVRTADSDVVVIVLGFPKQFIEINHNITVVIDFQECQIKSAKNYFT